MNASEARAMAGKVVFTKQQSLLSEELRWLLARITEAASKGQYEVVLGYDMSEDAELILTEVHGYSVPNGHTVRWN